MSEPVDLAAASEERQRVERLEGIGAQMRDALPLSRGSREQDPVVAGEDPVVPLPPLSDSARAGVTRGGGSSSYATTRYTWKTSAYSRFTFTPCMRARFRTYSAFA